MSPYEKAKRKRLNAPEWKKTLVKELLKPRIKRFKRNMSLLWVWIEYGQLTLQICVNMPAKIRVTSTY